MNYKLKENRTVRSQLLILNSELLRLLTILPPQYKPLLTSELKLQILVLLLQITNNKIVSLLKDWKLSTLTELLMPLLMLLEPKNLKKQ